MGGRVNQRLSETWPRVLFRAAPSLRSAAWIGGALCAPGPLPEVGWFWWELNHTLSSRLWPHVDQDNYQQLLGALDYAFLCAYAVGMYLR